LTHSLLPLSDVSLAPSFASFLSSPQCSSTGALHFLTQLPHDNNSHIHKEQVSFEKVVHFIFVSNALRAMYVISSEAELLGYTEPNKNGTMPPPKGRRNEGDCLCPQHTTTLQTPMQFRFRDRTPSMLMNEIYIPKKNQKERKSPEGTDRAAPLGCVARSPTHPDESHMRYHTPTPRVRPTSFVPSVPCQSRTPSPYIQSRRIGRAAAS